MPHIGWVCVDVLDLGEPLEVCEMCELQDIRYVHYMKPSDHPVEFVVGCVCAENMEQENKAPKLREQDLKNVAQRKKEVTIT